MPRRQSLLFPLPAPTCKTVPPHTNHLYPSAPRRAFSAQPLPRRFLPVTPRLAETNSGYDNANVRTRVPRLGKGKRHARLSAGMLFISNQVGEGKEKLSKLDVGAGLAPSAEAPAPFAAGDPRVAPTAINMESRAPGHSAWSRNARAARGLCRRRRRSSRSGRARNRGRG